MVLDFLNMSDLFFVGRAEGFHLTSSEFIPPWRELVRIRISTVSSLVLLIVELLVLTIDSTTFGCRTCGMKV